jgi:hypothetical protein
MYRVTFLSNSTFPLCLHTLLLSELKNAELCVSERVYRPVGQTVSVFVIQFIIIIIIIIIILDISFMQGIYTYIPETKPVPREHCVAAILM